MIPYTRHTLTVEDVAAVVQAMASGWLTQGRLVGDFERAISVFVGTPSQVVAVNSGTSAIRAMLNLPSGSKVIMPALTFVATAHAARWAGCEVVLADVKEDTLTLDPASVARLLPARAVIAVDYAGCPADYDELREVVGPNTLLLADAAHSFGAIYKDYDVGAIPAVDATAFSFHPSKTITTGEGGAVVTRNKAVASYASRLRDHGRQEGLAVDLGFNLRMSEMHAALGLSQLKRADQLLSRREEIAESYAKHLHGLLVPENRTSSRHLYPIRVPHRERFRKYLRDAEIDTQVHYMLVCEHPVYASCEKDGSLPVATKAAEELVSLPIFPDMTDVEVERVISIAREALSL